jgi:hypothetical protein
MLHILIPSYSRSADAINTVCALVNGSPKANNYQITVIDNASPDPYYNHFSKNPLLVPLLDSGILTIVRNNGNVGMGSNIAKCFEYVVNKTGWLWIVSDDDDVHPQALATVQNQISVLDPSISFLKFSSTRCLHAADLCFESPSSLVDYISVNSRLLCNSYLLLSNIVYRIDSDLDLSFVYENVHTYAPHLLSIFNRISPVRRMAHSPSILVSYKVPAIGYSYGRICGLGVSGLKLPLIADLDLAKFNSIFQIHNDSKVLLDLRFETLSKSVLPSSYLFIAVSYCFTLLRSRCCLRFFVSLSVSLCLFYRSAAYLVARLLLNTSFRPHVKGILKRYFA